MKRRVRRKRKAEKKVKLSLIFLFLIFALGFFLLGKISDEFFAVTQRVVQQVAIEIPTVGFVEMRPQAWVEAGRGIVVLRSECWELQAVTEEQQALSIARGLEGRIEFRPLTHDLLKELLEFFEVKVLMTKIVDIQNRTFIGRLYLQQGQKVLELDCRPSDGIALAVRTQSPIFVKQELLQEYGRYLC